MDVSEEIVTSIFRLERFRELGTLAGTSSRILSSLKMEATSSSETPALTRPILCYTPEDGILHSHRRENLKFYIALTGWAL
jgi:hypothetical protein